MCTEKLLLIIHASYNTKNQAKDWAEGSVQFPSPMSDGSQLPETPVLR